MIARLPVFWRQLLTVLGGTLGAQALPLAVAPLLTRLCTPAEMGAFGLWFGVIAISAVAATLRLDAALILDHAQAQQRTGLAVVRYTITATAMLVTLAALLARAAGLAAAQSLSWGALGTLGLAVWLTASMQAALAFATSHAAFGKAAQARVWGADTIALAQLLLLWRGGGEGGLLGGQVLGLAAGLVAARRLLRPPTMPWRWRLDAAQRAYLIRHRNFWRFSLPSNLLNALVSQLPLFLIGLRHGAQAAGLYALTQRVLAAPISLLAASVLEVFKRESVQELRRAGHCSAAYRHTFKVLVLLGLLPSLVLFVFSPVLFAWVFGEHWRAAGTLARILAPLYFLNFVASPLSYVFFVTGRQKIDLVWQVALFATTATVFLLPGSLHAHLFRYALGYSLLYLVYLLMSWHSARQPMVPA